jgi:hypothetical protein
VAEMKPISRAGLFTFLRLNKAETAPASRSS